MRKIGIMLCAVALSPMAAVATSAGMYKWTDNEGNVHYSQLPPSDREAERLNPSTTPINDTEAAPAEDESQPAKEEKPQSEEARQAEIKAQNCAAAKRNLAIYREHSTIQNPEGKVITLSDEMRAVRIKEAQENMEKYCE